MGTETWPTCLSRGQETKVVRDRVSSLSNQRFLSTGTIVKHPSVHSAEHVVHVHSSVIRVSVWYARGSIERLTVKLHLHFEKRPTARW